MITETNVEILKARFLKGLEYCNGIWQNMRAPSTTADQYSILSAQLTKHTKTLNEIADMLRLQGYGDCVFKDCKLSDNFHCFDCVKQIDFNKFSQKTF